VVVERHRHPAQPRRDRAHRQRVEPTAGELLPLAFNAAFARLAATFDYPDVLREPTAVVLARFRSGGTPLILLWWAFALTAVLLAPVVVLLSRAVVGADATLLSVATTIGVLAAAVQFLGLIRWPFLVPYLARTDADPAIVDVVFHAFNRYLGVAVGEHLGYLLTGAWTTLIGVALTQSAAVPGWLGVVGMVVGPVLMLCASGTQVAERSTPAAYVAWSLWLIATGIALL
jgi:hypothetical protein